MLVLVMEVKQGDPVRHAAWVARCVGRAETAPLRPDDVTHLASMLEPRQLEAGELLNRAGANATSVCIVRDGRLDLVVPHRERRVVIQTLRAGDVDGDIQLLLGMRMPYQTRAGVASLCLLLHQEAFERLLVEHPALARRWLTSVSTRLARSHNRLAALLGRPLEAQVAQLLLDEAVDGYVHLSQDTLAAMLGARRPSVNRVLRGLAEEGEVRLEYGRVQVSAPAALLARAAV